MKVGIHLKKKSQSRVEIKFKYFLRAKYSGPDSPGSPASSPPGGLLRSEYVVAGGMVMVMVVQ